MQTSFQLIAVLVLLALPAWGQDSRIVKWSDSPSAADSTDNLPGSAAPPKLSIEFDRGPLDKVETRGAKVETRGSMVEPPIVKPAEEDFAAETTEKFEAIDIEESDSVLRSLDSDGTVADDPLAAMDWDAIFVAPPRELEVKPVAPATMHSHRDPHLGIADQRPYTWAARNTAHRTLYFEDMPLERYGQSAGCLQPAKSAVRFLADTITFPLQWVHERPCELHYTLPLERAGGCTPPLKQPIVPHVK